MDRIIKDLGKCPMCGADVRMHVVTIQSCDPIEPQISVRWICDNRDIGNQVWIYAEDDIDRAAALLEANFECVTNKAEVLNGQEAKLAHESP